jgi:hypothetical protein
MVRSARFELARPEGRTLLRRPGLPFHHDRKVGTGPGSRTHAVYGNQPLIRVYKSQPHTSAVLQNWRRRGESNSQYR